MKQFIQYRPMIPACCAVITILLVVTILGSQSVTVISRNTPVTPVHTVIIDAGHGGVDGGATSCTGILESRFNLEIALRLEDLLHLLGLRTKMIRTTDCSIYTRGDSIAAKKVSDLKERVRIVNETEGAILVSLHQNYFSDSKYYGAQTFYTDTPGSQALAEALQRRFISTLNPESKRSAKKASGIYLMEHIEPCGVLIECGFLSNPAEEARLRDGEYQKKLCCVIGSVLSTFLKADYQVSI